MNFLFSECAYSVLTRECARGKSEYPFQSVNFRIFCIVFLLYSCDDGVDGGISARSGEH